MNIRLRYFIVYKRKVSPLHSDEERITRLTLNVKGTNTIIKEKKDTNLFSKGKSDDTSWYYMGMFSQIGFSIALPIAGCAIVGKMADDIWKTTPKWTLVGLGIGISVSVITFIHVIKTLLQDKTK